jgi:hypothetical protein
MRDPKTGTGDLKPAANSLPACSELSPVRLFGTRLHGSLLAVNESNPCVEVDCLPLATGCLLLGPARPGTIRLTSQEHFLRFHHSSNTYIS